MRERSIVIISVFLILLGIILISMYPLKQRYFTMKGKVKEMRSYDDYSILIIGHYCYDKFYFKGKLNNITNKNVIINYTKSANYKIINTIKVLKSP